MGVNTPQLQFHSLFPFSCPWWCRAQDVICRGLSFPFWTWGKQYISGQLSLRIKWDPPCKACFLRREGGSVVVEKHKALCVFTDWKDLNRLSSPNPLFCKQKKQNFDTDFPEGGERVWWWSWVEHSPLSFSLKLPQFTLQIFLPSHGATTNDLWLPEMFFFNITAWGGASGKEPTCQCKTQKRHGFHLWIGKIPWRGNGNPLQCSCLENPHGQRSLEGYSPWDWKGSDTAEAT